MTVNKLDFKKEYKALFSPSPGKPEMIEVPAFKYIMIDGRGNPNNNPEFEAKVAVLYGLSYTIKFMFKKDSENPFDFTVAPLSGLWYAEDMDVFMKMDKDQWQWTMMILQPDRVTPAVFGAAREIFEKKKNPPYLGDASLKVYDEGLCAQIMHIGPYSEEGPTIETLHSYFKERGYTFNGKHHEIYLGDPRKSKPDKLKTIIRQPVRKA